MSHKKTYFFVVVATILALVLMVIGFSTPVWKDERSESTQGQGSNVTQEYSFGLQSFDFSTTTTDSTTGQLKQKDEYSGPLTPGDITYTHTTPGNVVTKILTPDTTPTSTSIYDMLGSIVSDPKKARDAVYGTAIPAFIIGVVFLVLVLVHRHGKGPHFIRHIAIVLGLITTILVFIGVFAYSAILNAGYSLVLWSVYCVGITIAAAIVFFASSHTSGKGRFIPLVFLVLGLIFGIVALATSHWLDDTQTVIIQGIVSSTVIKNAGVNAYRYDASFAVGPVTGRHILESTFWGDTFTTTDIVGSTTKVEEHDKCDDVSQTCGYATSVERGDMKPAKDGAIEVLGCGSTSMILAFVGGILMGLLYAGKGHHCVKLASVALLLAAAFFGYLGLVLYMSHTNVGYAYVLYAVSAFVWVIVLCASLVLLYPSEVGEKAGLLGKH